MNDRFSVFHFAGEVQYYIEGFLEKNNDTLWADLEALMHSSEFDFMPHLFSQSSSSELPVDAPSPTISRTTSAAGGSGSKPAQSSALARVKVEKTRSINTIASTFRRQLNALEQTLLATTPHYVRCIKPNKLKAANLFDAPMILDQLLYSGVLETVRIRRQGFPFRQSYYEFWTTIVKSKLYKLVPQCEHVGPRLAFINHSAVGKRGGSPSKAPAGTRIITALTLPDDDDDNATPLPAPVLDDSLVPPEDVAAAKKGVEVFVSAMLEPSKWTFGQTKVFLKDGCLEAIHHRFRVMHSIIIQAWYRCRKLARRYYRFRRAVKCLQRAYRAILMRRKFAAFSRQLAVLQAHVRRRRAVRRYNRMKKRRGQGAVLMQAAYRRFATRRRFLATRGLIQRIQRNWRAVLSRRRITLWRWAVRKVQDIIRERHARMREERLRRAAENGAVKMQSFFKMITQRSKFRRYRKQVAQVQALWRAKQARALAYHRFQALLTIQRNLKMVRSPLCPGRCKSVAHFIVIVCVCCGVVLTVGGDDAISPSLPHHCAVAVVVAWCASVSGIQTHAIRCCSHQTCDAGAHSQCSVAALAAGVTRGVQLG